MNYLRWASILRNAVCGRRIGNWDSLPHTIEVRGHVGPMPAGRPITIENLRRIGLEQHAVEHAVAAQSDALKGKSSFRELIGRTERLKCHLRVLARHIEDTKVLTSRGQPRHKRSAANVRRSWTSGLDD